MQRFLRRVAVIGGARIPFCRSNTFYADQSNLDLMTGALNALVQPTGAVRLADIGIRHAHIIGHVRSSS